MPGTGGRRVPRGREGIRAGEGHAIPLGTRTVYMDWILLPERVWTRARTRARTRNLSGVSSSPLNRDYELAGPSKAPALRFP